MRRIPALLTGPMARHSAASLALKLFATGSGFLFAVAAARLLGARGYGIMSVALSVTAVATTVSLMGIEGLALREVAAKIARHQWGDLRGFIRWAVWAVAVASLAVAAAVGMIAAYAEPYSAALLIAAGTVPVMAGLQLVRAMTQGSGRVIAAQVPLDAVRWTTILLLIALLYFGGGRASPVVVLLINWAAVALALLIAAMALRRIVGDGVAAGPGRRGNQHWLRQSMPFLGVALMGIAGTEVTTLLLGSLSGPSAAAYYQPIAKLAPIMLLARDAIEMPLAPRIVHMWEAGRLSDLARFLQHSARASGVTTIVLCAATVLLSGPVFAAFGPDFLAYRHYLYWIVAAQIVNASFGASPLLLAMVGSMKRRIYTQAVTFVVQCGLALLLIPRWGVSGAVFSLSAAIVTWTLAHWLLAWKTAGIDTSAFGFLRLFARHAA